MSTDGHCYICMEPCPDEISPCKCQIPVHYTCLQQFRLTAFREENGNAVSHCTVCNHNFVEVPFYSELRPPVVPLRRRRTPTRSRGILARIWYSLMIMFMLAYVSKAFQYLMLGGKVSDDFWYPTETYFLLYCCIYGVFCMLLCLALGYNVASMSPAPSSESEELIGSGAV